MKKLTKVLSLVLVVAMVLGLCVIGAGATFTDNTKITKDYNEAVTVMTDLKVVGGYKDGSFKPAGTLTRAEACVILANMTLGTTAASALAPSGVTFKDVPASFWGYKFVEYCYQCGYIAGTGAGKFSPSATLTGYQWALMLMKVLKYDMSTLSTGNWQINTAKVYYADTTKFSNVAISGASVTREAATKMAYDALFHATNATTGYPVYLQAGAGQATATDAVVAYYNSYNEAMSGATMYNALGSKTAGTAGSYYAGLTSKTIKDGTSIAKTVFGVTKATTVDHFGRPATTYTASTAALGKTYGWTNATKSFVAQPTAEYTTAVTGAKVFADLGLTKALTSHTKVIDGVSASCTEITFNNTVNVVGTGAGVLTQVFYDADTNTAIVAEINTYFGIVSAVNAATSVAPATVNVVPSTYSTLSGFVGGAVAATGLKANDYVIYTVSKVGTVYTVESVAAAEKQTVTPTSYTGTGFTAGGTTYSYSAKSNGTVTAFTAVDVYLDSYKNAITVTGAVSVANYAVALNAVTNTASLDGTSYTARLLMTDGKTVDVAIDSASYTLFTTTMAGKPQLVSWTKNATTNVYTLTDAVAVAPYQAADAAKNAVSVKTGVPSFTLGTIAGSPATYTAVDSYIANNNTVFVTRSGNGTTVPYTYASYTGIATVPTLSGLANADVKVGTNGYAAVVYVDGATAVSSTAAAKVYLTGTYSTVNDSVKGTYYVANAIVDGAATTVDLGTAPVAGIYSSIVYNTNKIGTVSAAGVTTKTGTGITGLTYGVLKVNGGTDAGSYVPASDCAVYEVSAISGTSPLTGVGKVSSVAGIVTDASDTVMFTLNLSGQISAMYIQKVTTINATLAAANDVKATIAGTAYTCTKTFAGAGDGSTVALALTASATVTPGVATDALVLTLVPADLGATVTVVSSTVPAVCTAGSYTATYAVTSENGLATLYYTVAVTVAAAGTAGIA